MKQNNNHIYRVITVRQFVLDSNIAIYKPRVIPCSSVDRLVFPVRSEIFLQIPSSVGGYLTCSSAYRLVVLWGFYRYFYCINSEGHRRSEKFTPV